MRHPRTPEEVWRDANLRAYQIDSDELMRQMEHYRRLPRGGGANIPRTLSWKEKPTMKQVSLTLGARVFILWLLSNSGQGGDLTALRHALHLHDTLMLDQAEGSWRSAEMQSHKADYEVEPGAWAWLLDRTEQLLKAGRAPTALARHVLELYNMRLLEVSTNA